MAEELLARPIIFLDGGLGTTLEDERGIQFSNATPLWSSHLLISSPETLLKVQTDFARAGADIILTATYQASFEGFSRTPREPQHTDEGGDTRAGYDRAEAGGYMRSAVGIARTAFRDARRSSGLVALSLGAYGATMVPSQEYTGEYPEGLRDSKGLYDFHLDRITCFTEDEETWDCIDLVGFETLPRLAEIEAARLVMHNVNARRGSKEFWISCVFPNDDDLPDGSTIADVVTAMLSNSRDRSAAQPFAIGINCTKVHKLAGLVAKFELASKERKLVLPRLIIYPDGASGLTYDTVIQKWVAKDESGAIGTSLRKGWHEEVAEIVREALDRGAWMGVIVGGCCKTTPSNINGLRKLTGKPQDGASAVDLRSCQA